MNRLQVTLLAALIASSLYLVDSAYESRRLFTAIDRAQAEQRRLDHEHDRLLAERQTEARPLRVEALARDKLGMRSATPSVTQYVSVDVSASAGVAGTASPSAAR
jgi:cell division protein FtsL